MTIIICNSSTRELGQNNFVARSVSIIHNEIMYRRHIRRFLTLRAVKVVATIQWWVFDLNNGELCGDFGVSLSDIALSQAIYPNTAVGCRSCRKPLQSTSVDVISTTLIAAN